MKRNILRAGAGIVAGSLALGLAGCGLGTGGDVSTELSDEPVTLRMYWWGGDNRHQRTQEVIALFEDEHPNITVEPEFADWTGYWEKLATATAGSNSPDVIQMDLLYLAEYAGRGSLTPLDDLDIDLAGMEDSVRDMGAWGDALYAVPVSTSSLTVAVNTDLLDEIGVDMPDAEGWTYDEYESWALEVSEAAPDGVYGGSVMTGGHMLSLFARQHGEELFEGDTVAVSPETVAAFFQKALDMTTSGAAAPASVFAETSGLALDQLPISTGAVVSAVVYATQVSAYTQAADANLELLELPTEPDGVEAYDYFKPGMYWSASSQSEHPAEAALLIDFFLNDPEAVKIIGTERGLPAMSTTLELIADDLTPEEDKAVEYSNSAIPRLGAAPDPYPRGSSEQDAVMTRYMQEVLFERMSPAEAAEGVIAELQSAIDAAN
ncbi:ABC transporter substrate-binding protein [Microbacterium karelineae]|uniref:ABC transporter substrate-binding protein n=1 Tax=Microbacterium karelineae TaxID=2654283 RepID=UPI0012EA3998|nr:extracellular solute-binding protein [Microbacterium karelineae]